MNDRNYDNIDFSYYFKKGIPEMGFFEMKYGYICKDKLLVDLIKKMLLVDFDE